MRVAETTEEQERILNVIGSNDWRGTYIKWEQWANGNNGHTSISSFKQEQLSQLGKLGEFSQAHPTILKHLFHF